MGIAVSLVMDVVLAGLLVATIVVGVLLNRKLAALRNAKADMEVLLQRLGESTALAESGLAALKAHAEKSGTSLNATAGRARGLVDELTFLLDKGDALAKRLGERIEAARSTRGKGPEPAHHEGTAGTGFSARLREARAATDGESSPEAAALRKALRGVR